jgi:uncharacterized membrane protein
MFDRMTTFWLMLHLIGLVLLAAGVGVANYTGIMMGKAENTTMLAMWSKMNHKIEHIAILPGALLLIIAGSVLVDRDGYSYSAHWISAAYGLWVVAVILGAGVLGRHSRKVHRAATAATTPEAEAAALQLGRSPIGPIVGNLLNLIIIGFLYLMVAKPDF